MPHQHDRSFIRSAARHVRHAPLAAGLILWLSASAALAGQSGSAAPAPLRLGKGAAAIVVNAPDGPTLQTRDALRAAHQQDIPAVTLKLENLGLIQDDELVALITDELYAIAAEHGFAQGAVSVVKCEAVCE